MASIMIVIYHCNTFIVHTYTYNCVYNTGRRPLVDKRENESASAENLDDRLIAKLSWMTSSDQFKSNIFQGARPEACTIKLFYDRNAVSIYCKAFNGRNSFFP